MGNTLIKVSCDDQTLNIIQNPLVASGGINEDVVEFSFSSLWEGFAKTAVFYRDKDTVYHVVLTDDKAIIPQEVLKDEGILYFGVFGVSGDITRTSEILRYKIKAGAITTGTTPPEPTPDIYSQLLTKITTVETTLGNRVSAVEKFTIVPEEYELSGNPVELDNYEVMPMDVVSTFAPKQAGSGDPSPTNIRVISGWTGANLTQCGKNLLMMPFDYVPPSQINGLSVSFNADKSMYVSGTASANTTFIIRRFNAGVRTKIGAGTYTLHCGIEGVKTNFIIYDDNISESIYLQKNIIGEASYTFAIPETKYYGLYMSINEGQSVNGTVYLQIELGSAATPYEPYTGDTYTADFGQTVYGGTLNWNTGVLTVEWAMITLTGNETWGAYESHGAFLLGILTNAVIPNYTEIPQIVCSHYAAQTRSDIASGTNVGVGIGSATHLIVYPGYDYTADTFKSYIAAQNTAGTPVQVCYKLATSTIIQLTGHEITALRGVNTLYGDGALTVSGRKDILWLTKKLTERVKTLEARIATLEG